MTDTLFLADFRRACTSNYCPFCALLTETARRYFSSLLNGFTLAPDIHQRLARSRGFCRTHAWLLKEVEQGERGDGNGTATLYGTVLQNLRGELDACLAERTSGAATKTHWWSASPAPFGKRLQERLRPEGICLMCEHQKETEEFALEQLIEALDEAGSSGELALLYDASAGACLPHFLRLLERTSTDSTARWLAHVQRQHLAALEAQLDAYRRRDYQKTPSEAEADSWIRALAHTVGLPHAFGEVVE